MIKTYKRPIYSYGILYKASKNKYSLTQGGDDSIRLSFTYTQEDYPKGFTTYVDKDKPIKLIKNLKQYPYEPVVVKCIIDGGVKFELVNEDTYWSSQIGFLSEIQPSYRNFSIVFREKPFSENTLKIKNYSYLSAFGEGALVGGILGSFPATAMLAEGDIKMGTGVALGSMAIGGLAAMAAKKLQQKTIERHKKEVSEIIVDEPENLDQLVKKYPKLRDILVFKKHKTELDNLCKNIYGPAEQEGYFELVLDEQDPYSTTREVRWTFQHDNKYKSLNPNEWIACVGKWILFNTRENKFYCWYNDIVPITIQEYAKNIYDEIKTAFVICAGANWGIASMSKEIKDYKRIFNIKD